jgi:hypothetical protein
MQALYRNEITWAEAAEDNDPLVLDDWVSTQGVTKPTNAWDKPLSIIGVKRPPTEDPSPMPKKKHQPPPPKKTPMISKQAQLKDTLFIRDIPTDSTDEEIKKAFEPYGRIQRYHRSMERCFVIIRFRTAEEAHYAYVEKLNSFILKGKPRRITFAETI